MRVASATQSQKTMTSDPLLGFFLFFTFARHTPTWDQLGVIRKRAHTAGTVTGRCYIPTVSMLERLPGQPRAGSNGSPGHAETELRALTNRVSEHAVFTLDVRGCIDSWNEGAARIEGYRADEIIGRHFSRFYRPQDRWKCERELEVAAREGRVEDEGWRVRKDGSLFWANVVITAVRGSHDELIGFTKVTTDLTAHMQVEESLRQSEERFRLLVETVKDYAIFMLDPQGFVTTWNEGAQRIKGYRADEIIGQHFCRFYPEEDVRAGKCTMELELAVRDGTFEEEGWRIRKDGSRFWANVVITTLRHSDGRIMGFAKVTRDLTERRKAEEERARVAEIVRERLHELTELSEALAAALSIEDVGKAVIDRGMRFTGADTCTLYSLDEHTMTLNLIAEHGCNSEVLDQIRRLSEGSENPSYGIGVGALDAAWVETAEEYHTFFPTLADLPTPGSRARAFACVPLNAEGRTIGMLGVGFHQDRRFSDDERLFIRTFARQSAQALARARRLEAERAASVENATLYQSEQRARRAADLANRAKDEFLAMVSHELRTPLSAILGWAQLLERKKLDEHRSTAAVKTIARNATAMAELVEDLMDMSRIIGGKLRLTLKPTDLADAIRTALETVRPMATAKDVVLDSALESSLPSILGDATRLQQILCNLLGNAVKFNATGGRVEVIARRSGTRIEICVVDSGKGISPSFLPYVFEPFSQQETNPSKVKGGLGLGLAITKRLVELHGGEITAHSKGEGQGATFRVTLPVLEHAADQSAPDGAAHAIDATTARTSHLRDLKVLVVDDEEDARQLMTTILHDCGCRVIAAASAEEAMTRLRDRDEWPDVLLSDIAMPGLDGYHLIRELRASFGEAGRSIPAAALTAYTRPDDRKRVLDAGFSMHVPKPIDPAELVVAVEALSRLAERSPRQR